MLRSNELGASGV